MFCRESVVHVGWGVRFALRPLVGVDKSSCADAPARAMCGGYAVAGPALLVLPLFLVSLVNLFVAGPPLKTIVLESSGSSYGASLPFMKLHVSGSVAKFMLTPKDEMTHFFVVACYAEATASLGLEAVVRGVGSPSALPGGAQKRSSSAAAPVALAEASTASVATERPPTGTGQQRSRLQLLQPLVGFSQYEVLIKTMPATSTGIAPNLPAIEYRLTYGTPSATTAALSSLRASARQG